MTVPVCVRLLHLGDQLGQLQLDAPLALEQLALNLEPLHLDAGLPALYLGNVFVDPAGLDDELGGGGFEAQGSPPHDGAPGSGSHVTRLQLRTVAAPRCVVVQTIARPFDRAHVPGSAQ
jgi:hypothetical protein